MTFRGEFTLEGMSAANRRMAADLRRRAAEAVRIGGEQLKRDLRAMTRGPLGERIAKAWRAEYYGLGKSESPAAFVYTKAPDVIAGNLENITIVPRGGSKFFAIPTDRVPQRRGRGAKARMSPEEVEAHFNQDLILKRSSTPGELLGFVEAVRARSRKRPGLRQATKRRIAAGREVKLIHMFTFVRTLTKRKTIDPDAAFRAARARTRRHLETG